LYYFITSIHNIYKTTDDLVRRVSICVCHLEITAKHNEVFGLFKRGKIGYGLQISEIITEELINYPALYGPMSRH